MAAWNSTVSRTDYVNDYIDYMGQGTQTLNEASVVNSRRNAESN